MEGLGGGEEVKGGEMGKRGERGNGEGRGKGGVGEIAPWFLGIDAPALLQNRVHVFYGYETGTHLGCTCTQ